MEIDTLIKNIDRDIINPIIMLLMALAVVYFIWGIANFIKGYDTDEDRENGKRHMMYSIIGVSVMILTFAIINFIASSIGVSSPL